MKITIPSVNDFNELTEIWELSVRATHTFLKGEDILFYKPLVRNKYLAAVNLFCVRDETSIKGYMGTADDAIEMLFIHPDVRGTGIGKILVYFAITNLGCNKVDVNEDNRQAIGFYEKMGFKIRGRSAIDGMGKPYPILQMELG